MDGNKADGLEASRANCGLAARRGCLIGRRKCMPKPIQDTIEFVLIEEETVVNDTVKVTANLVGMVPQDSTEADLRNSIRSLLRNFIDIEWQFSNIVRTGDPSGQERITLTATTRIPET